MTDYSSFFPPFQMGASEDDPPKFSCPACSHWIKVRRLDIGWVLHVCDKAAFVVDSTGFITCFTSRSKP